MPSLTLSEIRDEVRTLGDYANSAKFTAAFLTSWINRALEEYHDAVVDAVEGYYDKTDATLVTVAGTQTVDLPADFYRLRLLERQIATESYLPLRRLVLQETSRFRARGVPQGYMLHGGSAGGVYAMPGRIRLWPIPDAVYTLRATYVPVAEQLSADDDVFEFLPGGDVFVIYTTLLRLDEREGKPTGDRAQRIAEAMLRIKGSAPRRDVAEPEYLMPAAGSYYEEEA